MGGPVTVEEALDALRRWQPRVLAGGRGLTRPVTWASAMRARLPAFEGISDGEIAFCSVATLRALRAQVYELTLPAVVDQLAEIGVAAILVIGLARAEDAPLPPPEDAEALEQAIVRADDLEVPLVALPLVGSNEVVREVIARIVARRQETAAAAGGTGAQADYAASMRASLRSEALNALLTATYGGEATMRLLASQLGYDLSRPHVALWIELVSPETSARARSDWAETERVAEALTVGLGAWAASSVGHVSALLPLAGSDDGEQDGADLLERVRTLLARELEPHQWSAGLGEPARAPQQAHRSATEARDAARLGLLALGPGHIARLADLGVYQLLLALRDGGQLAPFVERTLAPLLAEPRAGADLLTTLDAFFACNGNLSEAARRLHLHRNSLIYRLNHARELLGRDLDDPHLRLALQIAMKGREVLDW
ncbi:MAG TPA: helix-turn-helix domain-containing protein [Ktedonobacterales bacterium]|nr:helix-turn-helix domain-containing protein [Ktedonobacterales bacterium]